jgi:hypothetical protein
VIEGGHNQAWGTLNATTNAEAFSEVEWKQVTAVATASVEGRPVARAVNNLGVPRLAPDPAKLLVTLESLDTLAPGASPPPIPEVLIAPGQTVRAKLTATRNGFDQAVRFEVFNLPHGVIVDNIGLNGITLLTGETEREIFLTAARWVPDQDRLFYAEETAVGKQTSRPLLLKVRRPPLQARAKQ